MMFRLLVDEFPLRLTIFQRKTGLPPPGEGRGYPLRVGMLIDYNRE